jgi:hypothetical protein
MEVLGWVFLGLLALVLLIVLITLITMIPEFRRYTKARNM